MKILILGISGMLGSALFRELSNSGSLEVFGTCRNKSHLDFFDKKLQAKILCNINAMDGDSLIECFSYIKPDVVVNCIGLVKQLTQSEDPFIAIPINSLLPHRIARLCSLAGSRFIHISTDCVFLGSKGMYLEGDTPDANDLYGRTKLIGEVACTNAITLRTSIIGHELDGGRSLLNWFLCQSGVIKGYRKAIFSGLPTVELARVIRDFVIPNPDLTGLYHVSVDPIAKFDLLKIVANEYKKIITIIPDDSLVIDRSLDCTKFKVATGFKAKPWPQLISEMHEFG